jgi:hypothetical protein
MNTLIRWATWTLLMTIAGVAAARPVTYKLTTVTDGKLGNTAFTAAVVTIDLVSDTRWVTTTATDGKIVYENSHGTATLTVFAAGKSTVATFRPGQVFVRFDATDGIVGFGSTVGSTYPFAIDCYNQACTTGIPIPNEPTFDYAYNGVASAVADIAATPADVVNYSAPTAALTANLSQPTLMTGYVNACAAYDAGWNCPSPPSVLLQTNRGAFYVQDTSGQYNVARFTVSVTQEGDD